MTFQEWYDKNGEMAYVQLKNRYANHKLETVGKTQKGKYKKYTAEDMIDGAYEFAISRKAWEGCIRAYTIKLEKLRTRIDIQAGLSQYKKIEQMTAIDQAIELLKE